MLGNDVSLLPVSNVGVAELHAVKLGLTKDGMPCHQQKTLKPSAKAIATVRDSCPCIDLYPHNSIGAMQLYCCMAMAYL